MNRQDKRRYIVPANRVYQTHLRSGILQGSGSQPREKSTTAMNVNFEESAPENLFSTGNPLSNGGVWGDDDWD